MSEQESLRRLCGQLIVGGFVGTELPESYRIALASGERGGAILFRRNIDHLGQTARLCRDIAQASFGPMAPIVAVDQEGGRVSRLPAPFTVLPPMRVLGEIDDPALKEAAAKGYHKLLSYKDEFEVARLLSESRTKAKAAFDGDLKLTFHLAPPALGGTGPDGRPKKRAFGSAWERLWPYMAGMKRLRGTPLNPFGYTAERRMERSLIRQYEKDMAWEREHAGGKCSSALVTRRR